MQVKGIIFVQFNDESYFHCKDYKSFDYLSIDLDKDLKISEKLELAVRVSKFPLLHQIPIRR